jgi:hypothetical protein
VKNNVWQKRNYEKILAMGENQLPKGEEIIQGY